MSNENPFKGIEPASVELTPKAKEEEPSVLDQLQNEEGPLVDLMRTLSSADLNRVDIGILNPIGLPIRALGWPKDETKAKEIFSDIQEFLKIPQTFETMVKRRELGKIIAKKINKSYSN
jgi:hypothetical protein